jgi:bifunctional DNA-binding transcriptional regulator/antitoxin component of YhaV-PrlF toxin-antitoxin module
MSATVIDEKGATTLPEFVRVEAGLKPNDQIDWRVENGEIRGRKLSSEATNSDEAFPPGSLLPYLTPEYNDEQLAILSACVAGPIDLE